MTERLRILIHIVNCFKTLLQILEKKLPFLSKSWFISIPGSFHVWFFCSIFSVFSSRFSYVYYIFLQGRMWKLTFLIPLLLGNFSSDDKTRACLDTYFHLLIISKFWSSYYLYRKKLSDNNEPNCTVIRKTGPEVWLSGYFLDTLIRRHIYTCPWALELLWYCNAPMHQCTCMLTISKF